MHLKERDTYEFLQNTRKWSLGDSDKANLDRLFVLMDDQQIYSIFEHIEKAKRSLSENSETLFTFDYPDLELSEIMKIHDFENWIEPASQSIFKALDNCLKMAGLSESEIDLVCCTGGTSKVPKIQNELVRRFGISKMKTKSQFHSVHEGLVEAAAQIARSS